MKKNIIKIIFILLLIIIGISLYIYEDKLLQEELENQKIDEYNFKQLKEIKSILDGGNYNSYNFNGLKEFNEKFKQNILPLKNCYIISNTDRFWGEDKGGGGYVFGFKLYSKKYINKYKNDYYLYPSSIYNSFEAGLCSKYGGVCRRDILFEGFKKLISNPCKD